MKFLYAILVFLQPACATNYIDKRSSSPFFSDGKFHNPVLSKNKSLWTFLKMRLSTSYAQWPAWVDSTYQTLQSSTHQEASVRLTSINHSTVLIQTLGINIITDPIFSKRTSPVSWIGPKRVRNPGIRLADLPKIDIILISHDHYDHLDLPTLKFISERDNAKIYMGLGVGRILTDLKNTVELDWWGREKFNDNFIVNFVPVQHFSGRGLLDRNSTQWGGFVIEAGKKKIYFAGDTGYADHFKQTQSKFGAMDISLIPIGAYLPRDFMAYAHIDPAEAVKAHVDLKSKVSVGVHYGTFQLTAEELDQPVRDLHLALSASGIPAGQFITPEFGKTITIE